MRADYFALAYLFAFGGCYVDADEASILPLRSLTANQPGSTLLLVRDRWFGLFNSPFMAAPGHAMIGRALEKATNAILASRGETLPIWETSGTGLLREVFAEELLDGNAGGLASTMLISEWDSVRFSREENLLYKSDPQRNWRIS
jgi:hypothetical protein